MAPDNQTGQLNSWQVGLGLVAILALGLGFWQLRNSIRLPFVFTPPDNTSELSYQTSNDNETLKTRDSDSDSLSDFDETYLYRTSLYLKDSDSDGVDDKTEVTRGTDPNCAAGKTCGLLVKPAGSAADNLGPPVQPTAAEIRAYLKQNGASDDLLAQYSDQQLLDLYRQVAGEAALVAPANNETSAGAHLMTTAEKTALQQMTISELRQFLIKSGADKATLDKIDDVTLKAMVEEIINGQ